MTRFAAISIALTFAALMLVTDRAIAGWQTCRIAPAPQCPAEVAP